MSRPSRPQGQPYQGYPYVNPIVTDPPSLNSAEVEAQAKWINLPRKPANQRREQERIQTTTTIPTDPVSLDLREEIAQISTPSKPELDPNRPDVVYIDLPEGTSGVSERRSASEILEETGGRPSVSKDRPVVYIDIPESGGSGVSQANEEREPAYVQDTIFYDQFKDRRIELDTDSEGSGSNGSRSPQPQSPRTLNLDASGPSGFSSASSDLPAFQSKETQVYQQGWTSRQTPAEDFSLTPLPVADFPEYPPPYEQIDSLSPVPQYDSPAVTDQPRTLVITPSPRPLEVDSRRKMVTCHYCNATVHTLMVEQNGFWTHMLGCCVCVILFPLVFLIYWMDFCKYRNHYCPNCNKKIGYQKPKAFCCANQLHLA